MHETVIVIAKYFIGLSVLLAIVVWLRVPTPEKKRFVVLAVLGAIFSLVLAKIGSKLYSDPRPFVVGHFAPYFPHGNDNGFPSDHTLFVSFLAFTTWRFSKKAGIASFALAALIGLSRVVAGVHHLIDVVGSITFAFIGVWLAGLLVNRFMRSRPAYKVPARQNQE